jgi:glycosyltransferase involved in cell wall biosynthesis
MSHVVFYEPRYLGGKFETNTSDGGYNAVSTITDLNQYSKVSIVSMLPPAREDAQRQALESNYDVGFARIRVNDEPGARPIDEIAKALADSLAALKPTILTNLRERDPIHHYAMAVAARKAGVRYVMRVNGNPIAAHADVSELRRLPFYGTAPHVEAMRLERIAAHLADAIIVSSERERQRMASLTVDRGKIELWRPGVDLNLFSPSGTAPASCKRFLFIGKPGPATGHDVVERAFDQLEEIAPGVSITFAGGFKKAERDNRFYGPLPDEGALPEFFRRHDALIVTATTSGFPQCVAEAMACGLVCVLPRIGFANDFTDGVQAVFADLTDADYAEAMEKLASDPIHFLTLRRGALDAARIRFGLTESHATYRRALFGSEL